MIAAPTPAAEPAASDAEAATVAAEPDAPDADAAGLGVEPDSEIIEVLAAKMLLAWLRNRQQLLFPFSLNLSRLEPAQADLFAQAIALAAHAAGVPAARRRERLRHVLAHIEAGPDLRTAVERALAAPGHLHDLLGRAQEPRTAALVYAASLLGADQRQPVNRHYLRYIAARLQLAHDLVASLEQRFRA